MQDPGDEQIITENVKPEVICSLCGNKIVEGKCVECGLTIKEARQG